MLGLLALALVRVVVLGAGMEPTGERFVEQLAINLSGVARIERGPAPGGATLPAKIGEAAAA